jgi:uncharacterized protein (TIGR00251 family)
VIGQLGLDAWLPFCRVSDTPLTPIGDGVAISVWVVPGSSRSAIDGRHGNRLKIRVTSPPEGGKANDEVARLLSDVLGASVTIRSGMRGRSKVFQVSKADFDTVRRKLGL